MLNFFINLLNYSFLILYCFIFYKKNFLSKKLLFFLAITSLFSLIFNNFIFIDTFPDQIRFFSTIQDFRNLNFIPSTTPEVTFVSYFLSILPIPFIVDLSSAALLNRLLFVIFICYLYKKKVNENFIILLSLSPSIIIYSNLILKDLFALILCSMMFIELKQKKVINYFILSFLLFNVKSNLAVMIIPITFLYYLYKYKKYFFYFFCFHILLSLEYI